MDSKSLKRREFLRTAGRTFAVGALVAIFVKLSFNKSVNESVEKYPCLEVKSCYDCALFGNCSLPKAKREKGS